MATRTNNPVTLDHDRAQLAARLLGDYATQQHNAARRTRSTQARHAYSSTATQARTLAESITALLWTWQDQDRA